MSNLTQLIAANGPTVAPGTVTSAQYYTSVGWSAGEYIYRTPAGTIAPRTTGGVGYNATYNATSILSGASFTPSPIQSAQYSPLYDFGTFTGTTQTAGTQVGSNTQLLASAIVNIYSFNLINGNIGTVFTVNSGQVYLSINTPTGTSVALIAISGATAGLTNSQPGVVSGCCTTGGNVIVTWFMTSETQQNYAVFSQTGAVVQARTAMTFGTSVRFHQTIALSTGGWLIAGNASAGGSTSFAVVSSTNTFSALFNANGVSGEYTIACQLTSGNVALVANDGSSSVYRAGVARLDGTMVYNGFAGINATSGQFAGVVPLPSNQYLLSYNNNSGVNLVTVFNGNAQGTVNTTSLGSTNVGLGSVCALQLSQDLTPSVIVFSASGAGSMALRRVTFPSGTGATGTVTNLNNAFQTANATMLGSVVNSLNNRVVISWPFTSAFPTLASYAFTTLTNGTTGLTGPSYTPKEGWTLLGVAATTVAADGTGPVITNGGSVALNANYPLVSPTVAFNYQGSSNSFAQRGTVINRTATLQGLEI